MRCSFCRDEAVVDPERPFMSWCRACGVVYARGKLATMRVYGTLQVRMPPRGTLLVLPGASWEEIA